MNSSRKPVETASIAHGKTPLSGGGVIESPTGSTRDPYELLVELMEVVEELCPRWPDRETFKDSDVFLL